MTHANDGEGLLALGISVVLALAVMALVLLAAWLLRRPFPAGLALFSPLHLAVVLAQLLDGATTWVGVDNPFDLHIPRFQETVFLSNLIINTLGGLVYFLLKAALGVGVALALESALRHAVRDRERWFIRLSQYGLIVIGLIPVYNNTVNFLRAA